MAGSTTSGQLYLEAADHLGTELGPFVVAAMGSGEVEMTHEDESHEGFAASPSMPRGAPITRPAVAGSPSTTLRPAR